MGITNLMPRKKKWQACKGCRRNCLRIHGKKNNKKKISVSSCPYSSSASHSHSKPPSFFKIMLGDFRKVLFIPPNFAKLLYEVIDQNILLEDSDGNSRAVQISVIDGSLAFHQGWSNFVSDHCINRGELVIFRYERKCFFYVQIFGISACERLNFDEINNKALYKRKRFDAEPLLGITHFPKKEKRFEAVANEACTISEDTENFFGSKEDSDLGKGLEIKDDSCSSSDVQIIEYISAVEELEEVKCKPEEFHQKYHNPENSEMKNEVINPCTDIQHLTGSSPVDILKMKNIAQDGSMFYKQVEEVSDVKTSDCKSECYQNFMEKFTYGGRQSLIYNSKCSDCQIKPALPKECLGISSMITSNWDIVNYVPWSEYLKELSRSEKRPTLEQGIQNLFFRGEGIHKLHYYKLHEKRGWKPIATEEISCKFLLTEDGTCYIVDKNLENEGEVRVTQTILHADDAGTCFNDNSGKHRGANSQSDDAPYNSQYGAFTDSAQDGERELGLVGQATGSISASTSGKTIFLSIGNTSSTLKNMAGAETAEGNMYQSEIVPEVDLKMDEKEIKPSFKLQSLKSVKVEKVDFDERISPEPSDFSFTLPSDCHSFLDLPRKLPCPVDKRRHERSIVILRDPSMRSWPIMYHESLRFLGFFAGWKAFAAANNLQEGNVCKFFPVASKFDTTFDVQVFRS